MTHLDDQIAEIKREIAQLPAEFGLRAFPGSRFRPSVSDSFVDDAGRVVLYLLVQRDGGGWAAFSKGSPSEIRRELVTL